MLLVFQAEKEAPQEQLTPKLIFKFTLSDKNNQLNKVKVLDISRVIQK